MASRVDRFRDALFALDAEAVRDGIRRLPKSVSAPLHKAAMTPFPALSRMPDPRAAVRRVSDLHLLGAVADSSAHDCLDATLELLGDDADDPTIDQLRAAIGELADRFPVTMVRLMLASVAISDAAASDKCDELLDELPEPAPEPSDVEMPAEPRDAATPPAQGTDDELRDARRVRRRAQQETRRKHQDARARGEQARRDAKRARAGAPTERSSRDAERAVVEVTRRPAQLTPEQAKELDAADGLAGSVVIALVPFDDDGPAQPGPQHKRRPCVVIAASASDLLVRPCYSDGGAQSRRWQSHPLRDWVAAGLERATWVEDEARVVARADASEPLGRVSAEDWNALW